MTSHIETCTACGAEMLRISAAEHVCLECPPAYDEVFTLDLSAWQAGSQVAPDMALPSIPTEKDTHVEAHQGSAGLAAPGHDQGRDLGAMEGAAAMVTPRVDALMAKWDDDGAMRGSAFIELRDLARELEHAATTQASTAQAERVAEGWKLVPVEPTPEIIAGAAIAAWPTASAADIALAQKAARIVLMQMDSAPGITADMLAGTLATMAPAYRAMLAAAPAAPRAATSSTDAQAAAEVRDAVLEEAAKACDDLHRKWKWDDEPDSSSGPRDCASAIRALRAGDTGEQADGGAA